MQRSAEVYSIGAASVRLGEAADIHLNISESYLGAPIQLPLRIMRGHKPGPAVFVAGAIHGDELNGTGIIRDLILNHPPTLMRGTLVLAPVINIMGFERHSRYMPDRRDLNRSFPGSPAGSMTARLAHVICEQIIHKCDYGIDLHSAANFRTNMPNIRADMNDPRVAAVARAFGCRLIINGPGPRGSLRRVACAEGCATILLEAGETWKIEPDVVDVGVRGVHNVLCALNMTEGDPQVPRDQIISHRTMWVRAAEGGLLHSYVSPGDTVELGEPIALNTSLLGRHWSVIRARAAGIVMGVTTLPAVKPGDPVCHIAIPEQG
jgi:predicted deacylase